MTVTTVPAPRPLEELVSFGCRQCQHKVRSINSIDDDLRKQVRILTKHPDGPRVAAHKEKILELKEQKKIQREFLNNHIDFDHKEDE